MTYIKIALISFIIRSILVGNAKTCRKTCSFCFQWRGNLSTKTPCPGAMASLPLGSNRTVRPGKYNTLSIFFGIPSRKTLPNKQGNKRKQQNNCKRQQLHSFPDKPTKRKFRRQYPFSKRVFFHSHDDQQITIYIYVVHNLLLDKSNCGKGSLHSYNL